MTQVTVNLTPNAMGWTYGEIITYFAYRFDEDYEHVRNVVKSVLSEIICRHPWKWLRQTATITTVGGLAQYPISADAITLDGEMTIPALRQVVKRVDLTRLRQIQADRGDGVGVPDYFAVLDETNVVFSQTPDTEYEILYQYTMTPDVDVSDDDALPPIPRAFQHILQTGMEETMRMDDDRIDAATTLARRKFEMQLDNMIWRLDSGDNVMSMPDALPPHAE